MGWWYLSRGGGIQKSVEEGYNMIESPFRCLTYEGGYWQVQGREGAEVFLEYGGFLMRQRVVAMKKRSDATQGEEEFWAEVSVIGRIKKMNLVRMCGFCSEHQHRLLVYEHVENKSLDMHLFENDTTREIFQSALGTAKGLAYIHHECLEWIIHFYVKPHNNILLTRDFEPSDLQTK